MAPARTQVGDSSNNVAVVEVDSCPQPACRTDEAVAEKNHGTEIETAFSIFTTPEKKWIGSVASFGAMFSTLSSYIYFPALVPMVTDLDVSLSLISLTVTSYLIISGIAPRIHGGHCGLGGP